MNGYDKSSVTLSGLYNGNYDDVISTTAEIQTLTVGGAIFTPGNYVTISYLNSELIKYALASILTGCSYNSSLGAFQIGGTTDCRIMNKLYLQINGTSTDINAYIAINDTNISNLQQILIGCTHDNSLGAFVLGGTLDLRLSGGTLYLKINGSAADIGNYITNNIININALTSKTTDITFNSNKTSIANTLSCDVFTFGTSINGFSKSNFNNAIDNTKSLSSAAQSQIDDLVAGLAAVGVITVGTSGLIATGYYLLLQTEIIAVSARVTTCEENIGTLLYRTTKISYSSSTNRTTIDGSQLSVTNKITCDSFETAGNLKFYSLTQSDNAQNDFYGNTYYHNHIRMANGATIFALGISAAEDLSVTGTSTLNATNINADLTVNNTTTAITATTLNVNASSNFYGATKIQDNATTSTGTISPYLNVLSTSNNTSARKLQGVCVGVQQVLNNQCNANFGYNYVSDGNVGNFGYLGLNVGSLNIIDSLRWYSTKVVIQTGNFEVLNNASVNGSITCNAINNSGAANSAPLAFTATGVGNNMVLTSGANLNLFANSGAIKLNSNDVQIGSNQAAAAANTIVLGSISSLTTTSVPYLFKTNSITGYNATTALSLNNGVINIGYNEGIAAANTVNIGAITSNTSVNINGQLTLNYGLGNINVNSVLSQFV